MIRTVFKSAAVGITTIINDSLALVGRYPKRNEMTHVAAPFGDKLSQTSIDRIAAAQSKRDRRATKRSSK